MSLEKNQAKKYTDSETKRKLHYRIQNLILKQKGTNKKYQYENQRMNFNRSIKDNRDLKLNIYKQQNRLNENQEDERNLKNQISNYQLIYYQCKQQNFKIRNQLKVKQIEIKSLKQTINQSQKKQESQKFILNQFKKQIELLTSIIEERQNQIANFKQERYTQQEIVKQLVQQNQKLKLFYQNKCTLSEEKINKMFQQINNSMKNSQYNSMKSSNQHSSMKNNQYMNFIVKKDQKGEYSFGDRQARNNIQFVYEESSSKNQNKCCQNQLNCVKQLRNIIKNNQSVILDQEHKIKSLKEDFEYLQKHKQMQLQNLQIAEQCKYARIVVQLQNKYHENQKLLMDEIGMLRKQLMERNDELIRLRQKIDRTNKNHILILEAYQNANKELLCQIDQLKKSAQKDLIQYESLLQKQHQIEIRNILKQNQKEIIELKARIQTLKILLQQKNHQIKEVLIKKDQIIRIVTQKNQKLIDYKIQLKNISNQNNNQSIIKCQAQLSENSNKQLIYKCNCIKGTFQNQNKLQNVFEVIQIQKTQQCINNQEDKLLQPMVQQNLFFQIQNTVRIENDCKSNNKCQQNNKYKQNSKCKQNNKCKQISIKLLQKQEIKLQSLERYLKKQ